MRDPCLRAGSLGLTPAPRRLLQQPTIRCADGLLRSLQAFAQSRTLQILEALRQHCPQGLRRSISDGAGRRQRGETIILELTAADAAKPAADAAAAHVAATGVPAPDAADAAAGAGDPSPLSPSSAHTFRGPLQRLRLRPSDGPTTASDGIVDSLAASDVADTADRLAQVPFAAAAAAGANGSPVRVIAHPLAGASTTNGDIEALNADMLPPPAAPSSMRLSLPAALNKPRIAHFRRFSAGVEAICSAVAQSLGDGATVAVQPAAVSLGATRAATDPSSAPPSEPATPLPTALPGAAAAALASEGEAARERRPRSPLGECPLVAPSVSEEQLEDAVYLLVAELLLSPLKCVCVCRRRCCHACSQSPSLPSLPPPLCWPCCCLLALPMLTPLLSPWFAPGRSCWTSCTGKTCERQSSRCCAFARR